MAEPLNDNDADRDPDDLVGSSAVSRRTAMLVAVFVVALVPAVVGTFWVAERAIYRPLCSRDYAPAVTDVEIELPFDGGLLSSGDSGVTTCVYANGESQSMQTVVAKNAAIVLDLFFTVLALGMPFLITYGVARRLA